MTNIITLSLGNRDSEKALAAAVSALTQETTSMLATHFSLPLGGNNLCSTFLTKRSNAVSNEDEFPSSEKPFRQTTEVS